jgi:hypothetical protein
VFDIGLVRRGLSHALSLTPAEFSAAGLSGINMLMLHAEDPFLPTAGRLADGRVGA